MPKNSKPRKDCHYISDVVVRLNDVVTKGSSKKNKMKPLDYIMKWCYEHGIQYSKYQYYETLGYIKPIYADPSHDEIVSITCNDFVKRCVLDGGSF